MIYPNEPKIREIELKYDKKDLKTWGTFGAHDPSIFKDKDYYYVFSTDIIEENLIRPAVQIRRSKDLINWEYIGSAVENVPKDAYEWTNASGVWAPEVIKVNDEYYLYYCASTFGKTRSCIGLLKSKSIEGPWVDEGIVIKTDFDSDRNAIDPNLVYDRNNELWMSYGSFWTGIYIVKLDKSTGKPKYSNDMGKQIASRSYRVDGAIEGPYIVYNLKYDKYYLFVSYDSLFSDYNIRVGRADNIEGPYVDINGIEMTDINTENPNYVGNKIMGGYRFRDHQGFIAPGHNSILNDYENYYIVHHIRECNNPFNFFMNIRKIFWSDNGWPLISPERYSGEIEQEIEEYYIPGEWEFIILYRDLNRVIDSKLVTLNCNKSITLDYQGSWDYYNKDNMKIDVKLGNKEESFKGKISVAWDWELNKETLVITAMNNEGLTLWGKKR